MNVIIKNVLLMCFLAICIQSESIEQAMEKCEIVPDVIDVAPKDLIEIKYPSGAVVNQGNELTPTEVKETPTVSWNANDNSYYTLIFTDPDAPSRATPTNREFRHWLVGNIPGNAVESGETLFAYIGSGPPKGTGLHRYVFLVYKQNGRIDFNAESVSNSSITGRPKSSTRDFVKKFDLGTPIAGNFYQAQYDNYVPTLHAQLTPKL